MPSNLESAVKTKLGIKYVDAKKLVDQAKECCEIVGVVPDDRFDEVIEEACELFADLDAATQEHMKTVANEEPEWKRRALEVCQKREAEFRERNDSEAKTEQVRAALRSNGVSESEANRTTVKTVRKLDGGSPGTEEPKVKLTVRRHSCYCIVQ